MTIFRHRKPGLVWMVFLVSYPASVLAQTRTYSLPDLADSARKYLPVLAEKKALVNAAQSFVTETRHSFLPGLKFSEQLNIGSDNSVAGSYFAYGITPSVSAGIRTKNELRPVTGNLGVLYSEYELANFGLNRAKINNAGAYVQLREAELQQQDYNAVLNVARTYFSLQKQQYQLSNDQENIKRYEQIFTIIKALTASGINPGADSLLAKAELAKAKIGFNQTLGKVNALREQLSFFTGIPAGQIQIDTAMNRLKDQSLLSQDFAADTLNNPFLNYFRKYQNILATNEQLIRKSYLPKIVLSNAVWARGSSIGFNDDHKSLVTGLGYHRFNYVMGVALIYDLFNGIYKKDKLAVNRALFQASDAALQQERLALRSASRQADQSLAVTQANLTELPVLLSAANSTYNQKLAQYKAGIISLIDLTNASFVLYRSESDYTETLTDWYLAQLDKAVATGNLDFFIQNINQ